MSHHRWIFHTRNATRIYQERRLVSVTSIYSPVDDIHLEPPANDWLEMTTYPLILILIFSPSLSLSLSLLFSLMPLFFYQHWLVCGRSMRLSRHASPAGPHLANLIDFGTFLFSHRVYTHRLNHIKLIKMTLIIMCMFKKRSN